ncbi:MAG: 2-dehydropantoate 2-reductase [Thermoplasmata archaeon]|nr:2-dehydropantoate 2-reductase [Thermoplasmata archaeon]
MAGAGHGVTLIARADQVPAIREHGVTIEGFRSGKFPVDARERIGGLPIPDALILAVKTFDLGQAAREIADAFPSLPPTLLPQNGLRVEDRVLPVWTLGGKVPHPPVVRVVHSLPATWLGAGRVRQAGEGEVIISAEPPAELRAATARFRDLLLSTGIPVREVQDLRREVWRKTLVNASINPVTADHGVTNGTLSDDPWRGQALALLREARTAAAIDGVEFTEEEAEGDLFRVVRATSENRSSMLQDLERGRPTEIEDISGSLLAIAEARGVELPATRRAIERILGHVARRDRMRSPKLSY